MPLRDPSSASRLGARALSASRDRSLLGGLVDTIDGGLLVVDTELTVMHWNAALERLTGLAREAACGRNLKNLVPALDAIALPEHMGEAMLGEVSFAAELASGVPVDVRCVPLQAEGGHVVGVAGFLTDVSGRQRRTLIARALEAVGRSLASSLDLNQVLDTIVSKALDVMAADSALVVSWDGQASELRVMRAAGRLSERYAAAGAIPVAGGPVSRAVLEGRPISTPNILADPHLWVTPERRAQIEQEGFKAVAAAPLSSRGRIHGALVVHYWAERVVGADEIHSLSLLAEQAAVAIDNAQVYAEATRRAERLRELAELSQSITASLDTGDVMQRIVNAAAGMAPGAMAAVHVYDPARHVLRIAANSSDALRDRPVERAANLGLSGLVFERRQPVVIAAPAEHPRSIASAWWQARPTFSYHGLPIMGGDRFLGVLDYISPRGLPDLETQEALRFMAAYAGIAIHNASLYQGERTQAARVGALAAINQRISSALNLESLLRMIAESAADLTGVKYALFWLADEERRTLTVKSASAPGIAEDFPQPTVSYDFDTVGWLARHRAPLRIDDTALDERVVHREWWRRWGIQAFAGYPVMAGEELLAVLVLCHSEPIRFTEETHDVVDMFIAQASVAIQNARLFLEAQRGREVAEALARLGGELTGTLDLERIADVVARGIVELLGGSGSVVYRYEPEGGSLHVLAASGRAPGPKGSALQPGEGVASRAVQERRIVATRDVLSDPDIRLLPELRAQLEEQGYRAVVAAPLMARDRVVGAMTMGAEAGRRFSWDELRLFQAFADQASLAFETASLYASARDNLARLRETQAQLLQAGKMSAIGQLVSGVAHEINNPLSVIIGYGQLLLSRGVSDNLRRPLELMVQQADRMAKIVRNLLYFARQRPPERAAVNLNQVIEQTLALRLNQLTLSGVAVECDFEPALPPVTGDAQQLAQVILNLLLNAEQAIAQAGAGGSITFRTRAVDDGRTVRAIVEDSGPGIPPENLPRVFEPFFTTKEVGSGTGLGLSVSYGIVEEHGGRLFAESEPGRTVFSLELPAVVTAEAGDPAGTSGRPTLIGRGRAALVVDAEPSIVEFIATLLRESGWQVDLASGGHAALQAVRLRRYDLIVSDIRMADGGGEQFYREAVAGDSALAGRFVFITGDTANERVLTFLGDARVPVLEKPFPPDLFLDVVRHVATRLTASGLRA
jgi:PAS domain S-box-containing protein